MYAGLIIIMVLGILITMGLQFIEKWLLPWKREHGMHIVNEAAAFLNGGQTDVN